MATILIMIMMILLLIIIMVIMVAIIVAVLCQDCCLPGTWYLTFCRFDKKETVSKDAGVGSGGYICWKTATAATVLQLHCI